MGDGGAAARVGVDGPPGSVAIVRVVGAAGARRARDPVGGESAVRDVVVDVDRFVPQQRSSIRLTLVGGGGGGRGSSCGKPLEE